MNFKGKTVLDMCCAPGGKSFQLADKGAILTSIDKSEKRLMLMKENLDRLNYELDLICMDVFDYEPKKLLMWSTGRHVPLLELLEKTQTFNFLIHFLN